LQAPYPSVTGMGAGPITQPLAVDQVTMQRHVQQRDRVGQRKPAREVCNGPNRGRDAKTTPDRRLGRGNAAAADDHPTELRSAALDTPCRRASWTVNGPLVSSAGMRGVGAMPRMLAGALRRNYAAC